MAKFEKVMKYADADFPLPSRKTAQSAGYDMVVAEDICIPPYNQILNNLTLANGEVNKAFSLDELAALTKSTKAKPTLVSTGVKCQLDAGTYLELSVRSSTPLKYWLIMANSVGIIDADYYNNPDNEGEIFFQMINLSPYPIELKKGDVIGQGIIKSFNTVEDDAATGARKGGFGSTNE